MQYTQIQSQFPNRLTKHFTLAPDGTLHKETSAYLSAGTAIVQNAANIADFAARLPNLQTNEAFIYGIPNDHRIASVVSQRKLETLSDAEKTKSITRTKEHFSYPDGQAILMIDVDPDETLPPPTRDGFIRALQRLSPEFENVQMAVIPSASSYIYNTETGKELTGGSGFRVYAPIDRGSEIPRVAKVLHKRFIAAGLGFSAISKDGRIRIKSPIDMSVYTAPHLDFAAGASTGEGLEQRRGAPQIYNENGTQLKASSVVLSPEAESEAKQYEKQLRQDARPKAEAIRRSAQSKTYTNALRNGASNLEAHKAVARASSGVLSGDFLVRVRKELADAPQYKTVNELLTNFAQFDGWYVNDPYGDELDDTCAFGTLLLSAKTPTISAFDSGNSSYALTKNSNDVDPELREITITEGGTADAVDQSITALATTGSFFNSGTALTYIAGSRSIALDVDQTGYYLGRHLEYSKVKRTNEGIATIRCDPPAALCKQLVSHPERDLPNLVAITDRPQFRKDSSLIESAGYDEASGIYVTRSTSEFETFSRKSNEAKLQEAIETCFKFASKYQLSKFGKTSVLCAVLTAVFRPSLDIAPVIVVRSPDIGSGKSAICEALANIAESEPTSTQTKPDGEAEMKKLLLSLLLSGTKVILFDNADGSLRSKKLAAFATSATWTDRILGKSAMGEDLPIRSTIIVNGRGAYSADGMSRRVIPVDILPKNRSEMFKVYDFEPAALAKETRDQIIGAAMTLITAVPDSFKCAGTVPTYSRWDHLIRRTVAWLSQLDADLVDPIEVFKEEIYSDSEIGNRKGLLDFLRVLIDEGMPEEFRAVDILSNAKKHDLMLELDEHLNSVTASTATLSGRGIGTILSLLKDQDICGLRLMATPSRGKMLWRIEGEEREGDPIAA